GPGLSEVLRGEKTLAEAIRPTPFSGLSVLTAGQNTRAALAALTQEGVGKLFESLRAEYEFSVIDSSPLLPVADALLLAKHIDAVVLSIRPRVSRIPSVSAAYERLRTFRIPVLGSVVNGVRSDPNNDYHCYLMQDET